MITNMKIFIYSLFLLFSAEALAQSLIIGKVSDEKSGEGLPGVSVQIEGTMLGASSNLKGAFMIRRVPVGTYTLRITMIGYQPLRVQSVRSAFDDTTFVIVKLKEAAIEIDPVVVTASKWQQEADDTPATIEVMTSKQILERNPVRIEEALETAAGVQLLQENVSIRGSDGYTFGVGSKVLVLVDGVPVSNSDFGKVNWFLISPPDIERVEIVRGAGSALYGSSAMGGVINFITQEAGLESKTYLRAVIGAYDDPHQKEFDYTDDVQVFNRQDFIHKRKIGNVGLRIAGGRSVSDGYVENGDFEQYNLSGKLTYRFANSSKLTLFGNYVYDDRGVFTLARNEQELFRVPPQELDKHQTSKGFSSYVRYTWPFSTKASLDARVFLNRFLLGTQATAEGAFSPALGLGGSLQTQFLPFNSLSLVAGSDFKFDKVKSSPELYGQRDAILAAPYFQIDWKFLHNANLTLGGRYDRYEIYSDLTARLGSGRKYDHFSPKVGLNYHPFENTTLRASYSNGFKFPIMAQLFLDFDGPGFLFASSPNLKSELSNTWEVGFRQKITPSWFVEANAFLTNVEDLIEVDLGFSADNEIEVSFVNIPDVRIPGVEFVTNGRWFNNHLGLRANLLIMNPENRTLNELLPYRQKVLAFVSPSLRFGNVEFQLDYRYGSAQEKYTLSATNQIVAEKVLNARIFFHLNNHRFFIGSNNAGNYIYTKRDLMPEPLRSFHAGYTVEF